MTDPSAIRAPAPMEGHGAYNRNSHVQAAALSPAIPLLEDAARAVVIEESARPIVIADYGSSEGRNSLTPIAMAISALRGRVGAEREISVVHTDLPGNDFGALFTTLSSDPASYLRDDPATFASAVGRSFYGQILPTGSATLGWSSWALQWLSRIPGPIPDQVQVACSGDATTRAAYAAQSAQDWRDFLTSRDRELRPGARLVVLMMALHDDGDFGYRGVLIAMYAALQALVSEGLITAAELHQMAIPTVGRSREDLLSPFSARGRFGDLSIEQLDVFDAEDEIYRQFAADQEAGQFGRRWAAFSRASVFPTLALGLAGGSRDPRAGSFIDRLEAEMAQRLAAAPEQMRMPLARAVLVKR